MSWRNKSYDEVPALSVRGRQLRQSLQTVTVAWMFGTVWMSCVAGSRLTIFARMLGFNNFHFGLLAAVPFVATLGQLVATVLIERTGLIRGEAARAGGLGLRKRATGLDGRPVREGSGATPALAEGGENRDGII